MYVYSNNDGIVLNEVTGGTLMMRPGELWLAEDLFVAARPDLFSATPTVVHTTNGVQVLPATPIEVKKARVRA